MGNHDCSRIVSMVFLALDGELSTEEEKAFLDELHRCSYCLEKFSIEKSFKDFLVQKIERKEAQSTTVLNIKQKIKSLSL